MFHARLIMTNAKYLVKLLLIQMLNACLFHSALKLVVVLIVLVFVVALLHLPILVSDECEDIQMRIA